MLESTVSVIIMTISVVLLLVAICNILLSPINKFNGYAVSQQICRNTAYPKVQVQGGGYAVP